MPRSAIQLSSATGENAAVLRETPHVPVVAPGAPAIRTDAVYVVYTTPDETFAAIRVAHQFANALGVPVTVVHARAVPYPLSVERPDGISPIETEEFVERLRAEGMNVRSRIYLCRDEGRALRLALRSHSLIVVAGRRGWWPTRSVRLRRMLEEAGHFVVFVDTFETKETSHA